MPSNGNGSEEVGLSYWDYHILCFFKSFKPPVLYCCVPMVPKSNFGGGVTLYLMLFLSLSLDTYGHIVWTF